MVSNLIDKNAGLALTNYLFTHEDDIAIDFEDFGVLASVFKEVVGREPLTASQKMINLYKNLGEDKK